MPDDTDSEPKAKQLEPPPWKKQAWGAPLLRFDRAWTRLEARMCAWVLIAEIIALCIWISLKGLSAEYGAGDSSGIVFRGLVGALVLGFGVHRLTMPKGEQTTDSLADKANRNHAIGVSLAVVVGFLGARAWASSGSTYFSNLLNWMQTASFLTLIGGLRGVATRLTLWLALLGGSLATAQGKHINIDVVMRFLTPKLRMPAAVLGWLAAATMCFAGVWGFFDHIAIESFKSPAVEPCKKDPTQSCDPLVTTKVAHVSEEMGRDFFLLRRQISLDVKSFPKVLAGEKYNEYLHAKDWNAWLGEAPWAAHYPAAEVAGLNVPEDSTETRLPIISIPGSAENVPGLLTRELNFIFPFGLLMIGLRFILRSLLAISGQIIVDPDAAHGEEDVEAVHPIEPVPPPIADPKEVA